MLLRYFTQSEDASAATDHLKDSRFKIVLLGVIVPAGLLAAIAANVVLGRVILPADRFAGDMLDGLIQSYPPGWQFAGILTMKAGFAGVCICWYLLANTARCERWAQPATFAAIVVVALGVVILGIGFFV